MHYIPYTLYLDCYGPSSSSGFCLIITLLLLYVVRCETPRHAMGHLPPHTMERLFVAFVSLTPLVTPFAFLFIALYWLVPILVLVVDLVVGCSLFAPFNSLALWDIPPLPCCPSPFICLTLCCVIYLPWLGLVPHCQAHCVPSLCPIPFAPLPPAASPPPPRFRPPLILCAPCV